MRTARLARALGSDFQHSIVAMDGHTEARSLLPRDVDHTLLPAPPKAGTLRTVRSMRRILHDVRPDLVLTYNWGAIETVMAVRTSKGPPVIHHEDGFLPDEVEAFKRRRMWTRRVVLAGVPVVVPSHTLQTIATERWRLNPARVHWIPNGIRVDDFPAADGNPARRDELGIPTEALVVGSVGHLRGEKNPVRLIEALALVACERPVHLLMLGDGPERRAVEQAIERLDLTGRVHLVGHRESPQADYRSMDAFALSSDTEQMPVALLEAMACGLPVVATAVGDVERILPDGQRDLCVTISGGTTTDRLAQALTRVCRMCLDGEARLLGDANRRRVTERFSFDRMVDAYRERFAEALAS